MGDDPNAMGPRWSRRPTRQLKLVAGKLDLGRLGWPRSEGDDRDWQAIDTWAAAIAQQLQQRRVGTGGPDARA